MKKVIYILAFLSIIACKPNSEKENTEEPMNVLVPDEEDGGEMLLGMIDANGLQKEQFESWYDTNFQEHELDLTTITAIKPGLNDISIQVFMGTWCEDSQLLVPALFKVLDASDYDFSKVEMIAVDHDKKTPEGYEEDYNIEYVPTIIFNKEGKEIGRIVEYAQETLEKDMYAILSGEDYKHAYED